MPQSLSKQFSEFGKTSQIDYESLCSESLITREMKCWSFVISASVSVAVSRVFRQIAGVSEKQTFDINKGLHVRLEANEAWKVFLPLRMHFGPYSIEYYIKLI